MAKKSKKTAARYSELSRTRKRKRQPGMGSPPPEAAAASSQETAPERQRPAPRPAPRPVERARSEPKKSLPGYEYVRADLKRLSVLAGGMILVLIILAFVLG